MGVKLGEAPDVGPRFGEFALHASRSVDSACIRWNTNPGMSNGVINCPIDPGNGDMAFGVFGPVLLSIIGSGPCANIVIFAISTNYDRWDIIRESHCHCRIVGLVGCP